MSASDAVDRAVSEAAEVLRAGRVVAFPTETVYGLAADSRSGGPGGAVRRVFEIKGRPSGNPLIVHCDSATMARTCAEAGAGWPDAVARLCEREGGLWPGPVTVVVRRAAWVPDEVTAGGETVAIRVPDHPVARSLIAACGFPLVGPSANRSGAVSPTRAEHVRAAFGDEVPVLDGGPCRAGIESTVVDLSRVASEGRAYVLRPGVVGAFELADALGMPVESGQAGGGGAVASPGVLGPHYRPRATVRLYRTIAELETVLALAERTGAGPAAVLSPPGTPVAVDPPDWSAAMPASPAAYASEMYAALHEADAGGAGTIAVGLPGPEWAARDPSSAAIAAAIADRLRRAAM